MTDRKRRGRPALPASTKLNLRIPVRLYDLADALATKQHLSVPEVIRRLLWISLGVTSKSPAKVPWW